MAGALDLSDLVEDVKSELSVPGADNYPTATPAQWVTQLRNAFWEAVLDGVISGYTESEGVVTPTSGSTVLPRDLQQLVIYYVGVRVTKSKLLEMRTSFKAAAGPVKFEYEQSAGVMKNILDEFVRRRNFWLHRLSDSGQAESFYVDSVISRTDSMGFGDTWWVG